MKLIHVCKTNIYAPRLTKVNKAENTGYSDPILISMCSTHHDISTYED